MGMQHHIPRLVARLTGHHRSCVATLPLVVVRDPMW